MRTLRIAEWARLYHTVWRAPFVHLPKHEREKLVRACRGKAIYDSHAEARQLIATLPLRDGCYLGAYDCPLCGGIHTGNRKYLRWPDPRDFARLERCNGDNDKLPSDDQGEILLRKLRGASDVG